MPIKNPGVTPAKAGVHRILWIPAFAGMTGLLCVLNFALPYKVWAANEGSAALQPGSVPEGSVVTSTLTFITGASGIATNGRIQISLPIYWGPGLQKTNSTQDGYVSLINTTSATLFPSIVNASTSSVLLIGVQAGSLTPGATFQIVFQNIHPTCPPPNQSQAVWEVQTAILSTTTLADIASEPSQTYAAGSAQWLGFNTGNTLTVAANQPSSAVIIQPDDNCGQPVSLTAGTTVFLQGFMPDQFTPDPGALFSNAAAFSTQITSITLLPGNSGATFYYETSSVGNNLWIRGNYLNFTQGFNQQLWRSVNSLATAFTFSSTSVDLGAVVSGQTSVTISPDGSGINNFAYIRFTPSDSTTQWHLAISSNSFQTMVFEQWGAGSPPAAISWDGRNYSPNANGTAANNGPQVVSNGTYAVKLEVVGLTSSVNTSLSIAVSAAQISGSVTIGGSPAPGAQITAQSTNGPGYSSTVSDSSGNYVLNGLRSGVSYNLYATYTNPANQSVVTGQLNSVAAGASNQTFTLTTPAVIRVSAVAPSAAAASVFGNLNIHSSDYSQNYFGNLRLLGGTTTTDNGDSFNPSTWTFFYVKSGATYNIQLNMQGYGASQVNVSGSSDVVMSLIPEANVYGWIVLPSSVSFPVWASVSGTPAGGNSPTVWGGASFNVGQSSAIYSVFAVQPGTYNFVTQVNGYVPGVLSNIFVGTTDAGNSVTGGTDFPTLGTGGSISGTITIHGDTSAMASPINLWLNAYSPQLGFNVSSQVQLSTSATQTSANYQIGGMPNGTFQMYAPYLQGFDPSSFGPQNVTVSGGAGTANFTLTQESGEISGTVTLPNGNVDYSNVHISMQGPTNLDMDLTSPNVLIPNLGTGFYTVTAIYKTTGAQSQTTVNLTNGQTATVSFNLSASPYTISGVVSVQSGFSMTGSSGTSVTINTISDLLANATTQNLYIGGTAAVGAAGTGGGNFNCSQVTPISTTTARVEAFPKSFNSYGNSNRSGFTNCFGVGQYNYGVIDSSGNYTIPNLFPGVWEIDVYPYFDGGQAPDAAVQQQFVTITSGNAGGVNFALSGGNSVSGTVSLPAGVTDTRTFNVQIQDNRGNTIQTSVLQIGAAGSAASSASYQFTKLPAGQYSLLIQDPGTYDFTQNENVIKYVASPIQFTVNGADLTGVNVAMGRSARIIGTMGIQTTSASGTPTLTLITSNNTNLLPTNFQISAQADPWIAGGNQSADFSPGGSGPNIDSNNHFTIDGLAPGTYDVMFQQNSYGVSVQAAGALNIASFTQGSVVVTQGQTVDLGIITLKQGLSLSGTVTDTSGRPLSNIIVRATPSTTQNGQNSIQVTSDAQGNFTLTGLNSDLRVYDIVAAPRPQSGDSTPPVPYGQATRLAIDVTQVPAPTLNFTLSNATAQFTGTIATVDHGSLSYPDSDQIGYPEAAVFLHLEGSNSDDNPLGNENATNIDGSFAIGDLPAGIYDITVESLGYKPYHQAGITLTDGTTQSLGTITLQKGPELDATLANPDGSLVNTGQVNTVVAVTTDLSSIIFGQVTSDANTGNILSIKFSGFDLTPRAYNILLFDKQNNITTPPEGKNLVFTSNSEVLTRALTYQQSAPFAYANITRSGSAVSITYYFSRPLRNRGDDQDPSQWLSVTSGKGTLSGFSVSGDRLQLTVLYTPALGEQNATVQFSAHTVDVDPSTGVEFVLSKTLTLLLGQKATSESNINPALGGSVSLASSNDPSNVSVPSNALLSSDGTQADATISYDLTFTATDDATSIAGSSISGSAAPAITAMMTRGSAAFVSEAYAAMKTMLTKPTLVGAHDDSSVNPFSSFYSILLPAGISHTLNQNATLTLNYNTGADPTQINAYYFNGTEYLLENNNRIIDTVNHTISVNVSHFSTFVVLQNNAPVVTVSGDASSDGDFEVMNFPNPFDLQTKTKTLSHGGTTSTLTTDGTIIRYLTPSAAAAHITIYDVVGEKVRSIDLGVPTAGVYQYVAWDGKNDSGNKVASGVYIGELKVGSHKNFWKMAVIK